MHTSVLDYGVKRLFFITKVLILTLCFALDMICMQVGNTNLHAVDLNPNNRPIVKNNSKPVDTSL